MTSPTAASPQPALAIPRLIPAPSSMTLTGGAPFTLGATSRLVVDGGGEAGAEQVAQALGAVLRPSTGFPLAVSTAPSAGPGDIHLALTGDRATLGDEGYELTVTGDSVRIAAAAPAGLFHGVQTLRQLLPADVESQFILRRRTWNVAAVNVRDVPRFAWRGAMLDVARHFFTVREVKEFVDVLALYKMNVLHLHLSDDQGWRIEIRSRPKLAQVGGATQVGGGPGGYYTQDEYADIVRYARERYVTVVPEIDMPGHSNAALSAYPELSCGARPPGLYSGTDVGWSTLCVDREETYALIDDVVREIAALTPGAYFHIGGDEVEALTPVQYAAFVERVQGIVERYGKRMIGWEEIYKAPLHPTTIAQQWRGDSVRAAVQSGVRLLLSPAKKIYLDMKYDATTELGLQWAGFVDVRDTYDWDPATYLAGVSETQIVGVEAPIWSETLRNIGAVEYLAMPRLPAAAEVGWTQQSARDWASFRERLATHAPRWHYLGVNYYRSSQIPW
ncbi:MAG TPA: beta-N-acetylhexosaminidase [Gemmatimonadaceae bacterium]